MITYFDTSVLLPALVESHPHHEKCFRQYQKAQTKKSTGLISQHVLLEMYSAGTMMPVKPRVSGAQMLQLIQRSVTPFFRLVTLTAVEVEQMLRLAADLGVMGGALYDLYHIHHAIKGGADVILTNNLRDFRHLAAGLKIRVEAP